MEAKLVSKGMMKMEYLHSFEVSPHKMLIDKGRIEILHWRQWVDTN